ncbi:MAG: DUF3857 domain-containing protein [bacterium]|nr:DUF3857 domain-containing protein [bacterium]
MMTANERERAAAWISGLGCASSRRLVALGVALACVGTTGCQAAAPQAAQVALTPAVAPQMLSGPEEYPQADAINIRWEHHWTLEKNGKVHRREHRWIKLRNSRPIRQLADPRIDFCDGVDELIIHAAQAHLPDGTVMPVPDYAFNLAGPDDVGGWPHYAAWQQQVICFAGIEDGVILELDYEIVTPSGVYPWISADLRLDDVYPTLEHLVSVTIPERKDLNLRHRLDGIAPDGGVHEVTTQEGMSSFKWTFANLPASPGEPQSFPWKLRCPRLRFTTCPSAQDWAANIVKSTERAAIPTEALRKFAESACKDEANPSAQARKIAKKVRDSFNFLNSWKTYRSYACRPAAEVLQANYGSPLESAALCAAALRALDFKASLAVAVNARTWSDSVPTDAALAGVVVVADLPEGRTYFHPQEGEFRNPGGWGRHNLLTLEGGELVTTYVAERGETAPSDVQLSGKVTIDAEGQATGELRIRLTGGFYDPLKLETAAKQKKLVEGLVGRILSDFEVTDHSIATLSDDALQATASVASKDALKDYDKRFVLTLGDGPVFLHDFPLPLDRSYRSTAVHVNGAARENVDLAIELPEAWSPLVTPATLKLVEGPWGAVGQKVEVEDQTVRFRRVAEIRTDTINPDDFESLREAVNTLRAAASRYLACGKQAADD